MTDRQHIGRLLYLSLQGNLSSQEQELLDTWRKASPDNQLLWEELLDENFLSAAIAEHHPENLAAIRHSIHQKIVMRVPSLRRRPVYRSLFFRAAVAASVLLMVGLISYYFFFNKTSEERPVAAVTTDVAPPATNRAMIVTAGGTVIYLDSASNGTILQQDGISINKTSDGQLVYEGTGQKEVLHTLTNPRGSKVIDMTLADGSRVWLNAGSSVRYPVAFVSKERKVEITGEAYFEVNHDAARPFFVQNGETVVQVLGTKFNVNAYEDEEDIKVTLLEGSVKVSNDQSALTIKPNEQAVVTNNNISLNAEADIEQVMAWKNGKFQFSGNGIEEVMRQISRWYDVEVIYEVKPQNQHFRGGISRDVEASKVLKMLETTEAVHFRIEGKKVFVIK